MNPPNQTQVPAQPQTPALAPAKPRLHRAPLLAPAAAMVLGIVAGRYLTAPAGAWLVLGVLATAGAAACFPHEHLRRLCAAAAIVAVLALSATYVRWLYFDVPADHVVNYTDLRETPATLEGQIVTSPQIVSDPPEATLPYKRPDRTVFLLQCRTIQTRQGPRPATGLVRVTVDEPARLLAAGQSVRVVCWIGRFPVPRNPGQFDQAAWGRQKHTLVWASVRTAQGVTPLDAGPQSWLARAYWHIRAATRQHLDGLGEPENGHLVDALIIGQRHRGLDSLNQAMMKAGVAHYLAIAGTHLAIFLGFFYLLCRLLALTTRRAATAVLVLLVAYMLLAEPSSPLLRSAIMAGAVAMAAIVGRRTSRLNALAAACIVLLIADPLDLFSAGFQFSFGIVLGLVLLTEPLRQRLFGRFLHRRGLMVFRHDQRVRRWLYHKAGDWAMSTAAFSMVAFVISAPLAAYHFGMFSPYSALLTVVLAVPVTMVLVSGHISLALLWPMPNLSEAVGNFSAWSAGLLEHCVRWSQALPGLCLPMRPVSPGWVLLCYALVAMVWLRRRIPLAWVWIAVGAVALAGWTVQSQRPAPPPALAEIHVLAVGAGQCVVLQDPEGQTYIFDAGTRGAFDVYRTILAPFLRERRLPAPDEIFISHADADHYNALIGLLPADPPRTLFLNNFFGAQSAKQEPQITQVLDEAGEQHVQIVRLQTGQEVALGSHVRVQVLWSPAQMPPRYVVNDTSLALRVTCDGNTILIAGDAVQYEEDSLLKNPQALKCDVLMMPHHGGFVSSTDRFVQAVAPRAVVISNSHDPAPLDPAKPGASFYHKLHQAREVHETWKEGCLRIRLGNGTVQVEPER
jgi:competence protein ComEC